MHSLGLLLICLEYKGCSSFTQNVYYTSCGPSREVKLLAQSQDRDGLGVSRDTTTPSSHIKVALVRKGQKRTWA